MSFFEKQAELLRKSNEGEQPEYETRGGRADGEGVLFEQLTAGLVFLRCVRRRLTFLLSSNDTAGGTKFDDLVLTWQDEHKGQKEGAPGLNGAPTMLPSETGNQDRPSLRSLFVQQKYKTSPKRKTILFDHITKKSEDFCIRNFHDSYMKIIDSLNGGNYALVVYTNSTLGEEVEHMFIPQDLESFPWMKLLESGGGVYKLNPDNEDVKRALEKGDDRFIPNFYLFCGQSNNEGMKDKIRSELQIILAADESSSKTMCEDLCSSITEWMKKHKFYLTSDWKSWLNIVDTYIKKEVTTCNSVVTRIKYINVEALQAYIEGHNPAWIRAPGREVTALTATKVHQIIHNEKHIMVSVTRLIELQEKILCCWGRFCPWLVLVNDTEKNFDILHAMVKQAEQERRLIIVSHKGDDSFLDTIKSVDICDNTWTELINVEIRLNSEQYSCHLEDLCDTKALKAMVDEKPEALVAISQVAGPLRVGQDLDPLPDNHIRRDLISRMCVREEFFSTLGEEDVCIIDEVSYNLLISVRVLRNVVKFEGLEKQLCASNALWPVFGVTENIYLPVIQIMCSKYKKIRVYVLTYKDNAWEILLLHRGSAKIRPHVKEQSRSLCQIVDSLSSRIIVDGKPGIGKSTFLLDIASQVKGNNPSWWILRINLLTYSKVFNSSTTSFDAVNDILLRVVYNEKNVGILEHSLLQHCLKEYAHIICLVDGFDEICPEYAEKCLQVLQQLAPLRGKMVVTTRPSETGHLEDALGVLAHSLPAFSEEEVNRFLQGCNSELGATEVVVELLKIPLFSRMYAEVLESGTVVDDIVSLYEIFFERKFRILYEEKLRNDLSIPGNTIRFDRERGKQEKHLGFLAVSHLLPKLEVPCAAQTSSTDTYELLSAGVIYKFIDDKAVFIHRTFAEHFLAKWCFSDDAKAHCANVYMAALCDNSLEFFVESFDRMASRGRPLLTAVLNGSESEVESLLQKGADPAERDEVGRNSLHLAAAYSRDSPLLWLIVGRLKMAGAERVGGSALGPAGLWAVAEAATDPVTAALGAEDELLRWTPLRHAAERQRWWTVDALLEAGAQLRHLGDFQRGLHHPQELWRVFKGKGYRALIHHIRGKNDWRSSKIKVGLSIVCAEMSPEQYEEICSEALRDHDWEVARLLRFKIGEMQNKSTTTGSPKLELSHGTKLMPRLEEGSGRSVFEKLTKKLVRTKLKQQTPADGSATRREVDGWMELHRAAAAGDAEAVRRLTEAGAGVDMQDNEGRTALHVAANAGSVDCIKLLLSAGAAVNMKDKADSTPLHAAAGRDRHQAVRLLLGAGADALMRDCVGDTALHLAARRGNAECVRLMAQAVENLELKDRHGYTALQWAAHSGDVDTVKHLLAAGADTGAVDDNTLRTPLHLAAQGGHTECVRLLLQEKAGVAAKDKWGVTALHHAAERGNPDCVRCLLQAGAGIQDEDEFGDTPLHCAARLGRPACIAVLLEEGADVHQRNRNGQTPLHWAAWKGNAESVRLLLGAGADALARDRRGDTALHVAARSGEIASVNHLLAAGADSNTVNDSLETPLHLTAIGGHTECVRLLLQAEAGVAAKDQQGATALHWAVWSGNLDCVRCLLEAGAGIQGKDGNDDTPLHWAARYGRAACIAVLLEKGADVHQRNRRGQTPLHWAALEGKAECVRLLLGAGADAFARDWLGGTALHVAARSGDVASVKHLLAAGADSNAVNDFLETPLHLAAKGGHTECVRLLLQAKAGVAAKDKWGVTALHRAVESGYPDCVRCLLQAGAGIQDEDEYGDTPLHWAAREGRPACIAVLLEEGADVHQRNRDGQTPLHWAAWKGNAESVRLLLGAGADALARDRRGDTALHVAARSGEIASVNHLLAAGADSNTVNDSLETPLHLTAIGGHTECVRLLLQAEAGVAAKDQQGATALHWAVWSGNLDCVRCLLEAGAGIQGKDGNNDTPLHWAARYGRAACIAVLLEKGADVHQRNRRGQTPLHWAALEGKAECVRLLLGAGADAVARDWLGGTALHVAARSGDVASVKHLLAAGADSNAVDDFLETPLHLAAKGGHTECVRLLLQAKAGVAAKDEWGVTALHRAVESGYPDCVRCLLEAGADVNQENGDSDTPLHWAARYGSGACIAVLLEEGADVHQWNREGQTPLHCAAQKGEAECVRVLLDAGADPLAQDSKCRTPLQVAADWKNEECLTMLKCEVSDSTTD